LKKARGFFDFYFIRFSRRDVIPWRLCAVVRLNIMAARQQVFEVQLLRDLRLVSWGFSIFFIGVSSLN
jgi:hypothetical protein